MKIAVLFGGRGAEREVSISTGAMVARELRRLGHSIVALDVCADVELDVSPQELFDMNAPISDVKISDTAPEAEEYGGSFFGRNVIEICREADIVFNALHGADGENGRIQAAFDLLGIRYTGTGAQGSMIAMNKNISKQLFKASGIPTPQEIILTAAECRRYGYPEGICLDYPCVVKPCCGGSSVGVSIVSNNEELIKALDIAFKYENEVMIEQYIRGREFSVGIIGSHVLPVIEIIPKQGFYDYANKYQPGYTKEICPAVLDKRMTELMQETAVAVCGVLGLGAYARVDFMMEGKEIYCLEANTLPGMTPTSLLPQEAAAAGVSFGRLLEKIIEESMKLSRR